jgi:hypothetical protein
MPAIINETSILLQPDNIGYQALKIPLAQQPAGAATMVFYYKGYVDVAQNITEDGSSYGWNNDAFFGLSFSGDVSANTGGIVGFTNRAETTVLRSLSLGNWALFTGSGYASATPVFFGTYSNYFHYGHPTPGNALSLGNGAFCFPSTASIGVSGAEKFLGIIKISKQDDNAQNIVLSYGVNWEGRAASDFSGALTATETNWIFSNATATETTNFRTAGAINFPRWIVAKWPSGVLGRTLTLNAMRVEYYNGVI